MNLHLTTTTEDAPELFQLTGSKEELRPPAVTKVLQLGLTHCSAGPALRPSKKSTK